MINNNIDNNELKNNETESNDSSENNDSILEVEQVVDDKNLEKNELKIESKDEIINYLDPVYDII